MKNEKLLDLASVINEIVGAAYFKNEKGKLKITEMLTEIIFGEPGVTIVDLITEPERLEVWLKLNNKEVALVTDLNKKDSVKIARIQKTNNFINEMKVLTDSQQAAVYAIDYLNN